MYATYIDSEGFQRFSVAHEFGHYFLNGHVDHVLKDGVHVSCAGFVSGDPFELEADAFAAGLLTPSSLFKRAIGRRDPGLGVIYELACDCSTSLTATAIRYAELTSDAIAVIVSTGGVIDYCILSDAMKTLPKLAWLKKGSPRPDRTGAAVLAASVGRVLEGESLDDEIAVKDWLGGTSRAKVREQVVGLGPYGKTLTVLSSGSIGQDHVVDELTTMMN